MISLPSCQMRLSILCMLSKGWLALEGLFCHSTTIRYNGYCAIFCQAKLCRRVTNLQLFAMNNQTCIEVEQRHSSFVFVIQIHYVKKSFLYQILSPFSHFFFVHSEKKSPKCVSQFRHLYHFRYFYHFNLTEKCFEGDRAKRLEFFFVMLTFFKLRFCSTF